MSKKTDGLRESCSHSVGIGNGSFFPRKLNPGIAERGPAGGDFGAEDDHGDLTPRIAHPHVKRVLTPLLEEIARVLWCVRGHLSEQDRIWALTRVDAMFDARLRR